MRVGLYLGEIRRVYGRVVRGMRLEPAKVFARGQVQSTDRLTSSQEKVSIGCLIVHAYEAVCAHGGRGLHL